MNFPSCLFWVILHLCVHTCPHTSAVQSRDDCKCVKNRDPWDSSNPSMSGGLLHATSHTPALLFLGAASSILSPTKSSRARASDCWGCSETHLQRVLWAAGCRGRHALAPSEGPGGDSGATIWPLTAFGRAYVLRLPARSPASLGEDQVKITLLLVASRLLLSTAW